MRVAVSGDGRRVLSRASDCTARLWDVESATCVRVFRDPDLLKHWTSLRQQLRERPMRTRFAPPEYVPRGRQILIRSGGSEKVLATFEKPVSELRVIARCRTLVALSDDSLVFLRIMT